MTSEYNFPFKLGDYIVFDLIGKGGMAEIFLAKMPGSLGQNSRVVLKRIHNYLARIKSFIEALMNEAKFMERIRSPYVTQVLDVQRYEKEAFITLEYVEGLDLNRLLGLFSKHHLPVPQTFIFHVMKCILEGLDAVHNAKDIDGKPLDLIHLDLSPGNILISFAGEVKICDFGVATTGEMAKIMSREREIRGKFSYMSPEQAEGRSLDLRSDIFSAGIIFWELLSGRRLYSSKNRDEVIRMAVEANIPPLPERRFPNQEMLDSILKKALAKLPEDRYPSDREFLEDIENYIQSHGMIVNQIAIGRLLEEHFSEDILQVRYERERASIALLPLEGK